MKNLSYARLTHSLLTSGQEWQSNSLRGTRYYNGSGRYSGTLDSSKFDYYIYSYSTPIFARMAGTDRWVDLEQKYSVTTTKQQGRVRGLLGSSSIVRASDLIPMVESR
jgi:hypothetical protein